MRTLRKMENENLPQPLTTIERLARALGVRPAQVALLSPSTTLAAVPSRFGWDEEQLIPRFDFEIAKATTDEKRLYDAARRCRDLAAVIAVSLIEGTAGYGRAS